MNKNLVSERAVRYAKSQKPNDSYDNARSARGFSAGYNAARRDLKKIMQQSMKLDTTAATIDDAVVISITQRVYAFIQGKI